MKQQNIVLLVISSFLIDNSSLLEILPVKRKRKKLMRYNTMTRFDDVITLLAIPLR